MSFSLIRFPVIFSGGGGTVTSVGLTMPSAFSVAGSPVTGAGAFVVTGAGNAGQYINGLGALVTFPTIPTITANNGARVASGVIKVGQDLAQVGNPAILLGDTEIPNGGFNFFQTGTGRYIFGSQSDDTVHKIQITGEQIIYGSSNTQQLTIKLPGSQTYAQPFFRLQDSAGTSILEMNTLVNTNLYIGVGVGVANTSGVGNTVVGSNGFFGPAFNANTTGGSNTGLGASVLIANTTGSLNTAVGNHCMVGNTTGQNNTGVGQAALAWNNTGSNNTALGENAARGTNVGLVTYNRNTALGRGAYQTVTAGDDNIAIGYNTFSANAGSPTVQGTGNVVIGNLALTNRVAANNNIVIGFQSLLDTALGSGNIFLGANTNAGALLDNTVLIGTGLISNISNIVGLGRTDQNVIIGAGTITTDNGQKVQIIGNQAIYGTANVVQSLIKLPGSQTPSVPAFQINNSANTPIASFTSDVQYNTFIGIGAGINNTWGGTQFGAGASNLAIGYQALMANTTGAVNVAIGNSTLAANTSGKENVAVGVNALLSNTTGLDNTALGQAAMAFNLVGSFNTFVGHDAGRQNNSSSNIAMGDRSLMNNQLGINNIAIGNNALSRATEAAIFDVTGAIFIGHRAGQLIGAIGQNNIVVGNEAYNSIGSLGDNNIMIGGSIVSTAVSNTTQIGTAMSTNLSNVAIIGRGDQNILLGMTDSTAYTDNGLRLQVNGNASFIVSEYADNAAATTAGVPIGGLYRTGDVLKIVH